MNFLEENYLIKNTQHGFQNKRPCLMNFLDLYSNVFNFHYETKVVDVIYLDFKKTSNKVLHKRLLK